jgi:dTDP-4-dehydrorhamnose reductase
VRVDVLVIGGDSTIGRAVAERLHRNGRRVAATSRRPGTAAYPIFPLELSSMSGLSGLPDAGAILVAAAETNLARCRANPGAAKAINVDAPRQIATWAAVQAAKLVFLSSAAVLSGNNPWSREDEPLQPMSVYGEQKAAAESIILAHRQSVVFRPAKVLHAQQELILRWRRDLLAGHPITPFSDIPIAPVSLDLVVDAIVALLADPDAAGIFQLSANRAVSYSDVARTFASMLCPGTDLVIPTLSSEAGILLEHKPAHATLSDERLRAVTGIAAPAPEAAVQACI